MKDGLPESKRRNVATLIMMGNERKRESYIHSNTRGPLSLLYGPSMGEEEMKKSSNRICLYLSLCHILYICECSSCPFFLPSSICSFHQQCIVQAESSLFISLLLFVNPFPPDSDNITISVEYISFTYSLFINRYLILIKSHYTIGLTKIIESRVKETTVADHNFKVCHPRCVCN